MNFQAVEQANGDSRVMPGVFTEIGGCQYTANQKAKAVCKVRDDTGVEHKVHIYQGKGELPTPQCLEQRYNFNLSMFKGTGQNGPYTGCSGFWATAPLAVQPQAPQGSPQPAQATKAPERDYDKENRGKCRYGLYCAAIRSGVHPTSLNEDQPTLQAIERLVDKAMNGVGPAQRPDHKDLDGRDDDTQIPF